MSRRCAVLFMAICALAVATEPPVAMAPFRVRPGDLLFKIGYTIETDAVTEIRVSDVVRGSPAEKVGIRKGDQLTSIRGVPVVGRTRRSLLGRDGRIAAYGLLTFEGRRGLFRKHWSLTVESASLLESKDPNKAPETAPGSVAK
jgi:hypothetical protein